MFEPYASDRRIDMSTRGLYFLVAALLLFQPLAAAGQRQKPADRGPWRIYGLAGAFDDNPDFDPDGRESFIDPDGNVLWAAGLGYHFPVGLFVDADGRYVPLDILPASGGVVDLNAFFYSGVLGYTLPLFSRLDLYGVAGLSGVYWNPTDYGSESNFGFTYGGGVNLYLTERLALTGDFRMFQIPSALQDVTEEVAGIPADETFWGYSLSGGLSFFFGKKDTDRDGVKDSDDLCPNTPLAVEVDARGCPFDSDGDGVPDYLDRCPNTPAGARVTLDGCPLDSDSDGVFDGLDRCPNTPAGAEVDASGCPVDSDGDGVYDGLDRCPDTPRGSEVDQYGCPRPIPIPPPPPVVFTFEGGVNFGFDSAALTDQGQAALRAIGDTLVTAENLGTITVEGHSDSLGDAEYNLELSRRRAEAVRDFLVQSFPQLAGTQFTVRGLGESRPIASNDTEEGRARNRRVEIIVGDR
jgi:OOP family OmpA-OmpF porin